MKKFALLCGLLFLTTNSLAQESKRLTRAEDKFCNSLTKMVDALTVLDEVNENSSMDEFRSAYNDAVKAWNKLEKSAEKLEKVEMKESQKAYDKLVDKINSIEGETKTSEAAGEIAGHIDETAGTIADIMTVICL